MTKDIFFKFLCFSNKYLSAAIKTLIITYWRHFRWWPSYYSQSAQSQNMSYGYCVFWHLKLHDKLLTSDNYVSNSINLITCAKNSLQYNFKILKNRKQCKCQTIIYTEQNITLLFKAQFMAQGYAYKISRILVINTLTNAYFKKVVSVPKYQCWLYVNGEIWNFLTFISIFPEISYLLL